MVNLLQDWYLWIKALHVMSVMAWMAGLFYLPRLFVHHVEQTQGKPELAEVFVMMERKLFRVIMTPAMNAAWLFGILMLIALGWDGATSQPWLMVKLCLVVGMSAYHEYLGRLRRSLEAGTCEKSGRFFRLINEAPTVGMIAIVFLAVVEPL